MKPKVGEVYMLDLGYRGKVRPIIIVSREDPHAPRALSIFVPLTSEFRGSRYEVQMPRVPWLNLQSYANTQAMGSAENHELTVLRGRFDTSSMEKVRNAIRWTLAL